MRNLEEKLIDILTCETPYIIPLFDKADHYLDDYYLGAGIITQTVWNHLHGYKPYYGIGDADIIFYDKNITQKEEQWLENLINEEMAGYPFTIDVTNEALVHHWYEKKFNQVIAPYSSSKAAIDTWPTTASAIGVKRGREGYRVYAPFGLEDLFQMVVKPNKRLITEHVYWNKADKWKKRWPELIVIPW